MTEMALKSTSSQEVLRVLKKKKRRKSRDLKTREPAKERNTSFLHKIIDSFEILYSNMIIFLYLYPS